MALLVLSTRAAKAEEPVPPAATPQGSSAKATETWCRYVRAVAASSSAPMVAPQVFVSGGMVSGADASLGFAGTPAVPRLTAGVGYSVGSLVRGLATRDLAEADCARSKVTNDILAFVFGASDAANLPALTAKRAVLASSLPRAREIRDQVRTGVAESRTTIDELNTAVLHVDSLEAALLETEGQLRRAEGAMRVPSRPLDELLRERDAAERAAEVQQARVRQAHAWDVSARGGYDQVFGVRHPVPLFGTVTLTVNTGLIFQRSADAEAIEARTVAARHSLEATSYRALALSQQLRELWAAERSRVAQLEPLLAELEQRQATVAKVSGDRAQASADAIWLSGVMLRAELSFLRAHTDALFALVRPQHGGQQ
jgi:hypothetical protein